MTVQIGQHSARNRKACSLTSSVRTGTYSHGNPQICQPEGSFWALSQCAARCPPYEATAYDASLKIDTSLLEKRLPNSYQPDYQGGLPSRLVGKSNLGMNEKWIVENVRRLNKSRQGMSQRSFHPSSHRSGSRIHRRLREPMFSRCPLGLLSDKDERGWPDQDFFHHTV